MTSQQDLDVLPCTAGLVRKFSGNSLLAVGALVVENERCYLRVALPLCELTAAALDRAIAFIARESLTLRRQYSPSGEVPQILGMFAE